MGLSLRTLHAGHLLLRWRRRRRRGLLLRRWHVGHTLHWLFFLVTGVWTALVRLPLIFGGLREDVTGFFGQIIDPESVSSDA